MPSESPPNVDAHQRPAPARVAEDAPEALVGKMVGDRYEIQALLGVGGMGAVYRARHVHIKKQVALKTLHAAVSKNPEMVARFEREAIAAARIDHPNVVVATDYGRLPNGRNYLVLEYVDGRSLRDEINPEQWIAVPRTIAIARQIAGALAAAHQHGVVHRDLKPENIMLVQRGTSSDVVKVLDFGIAKLTLDDAGQQLTQLGAIFGTPQYMSPEQAAGKTVDPRSDLYSLGVILYEMLTGRLPFEAADALGFIVQHLNKVPALLPDRIPEPLRQLVQALLEKAPENRPASAKAVLTELDRMAPQSAGLRSFVPSAQRLDQLKQLIRRLQSWLSQPRRVGQVTLPLGLWILAGTVVIGVLYAIVPRGRSQPPSVAAAVLPQAAAEAPSSALPTLEDAETVKEVEGIEQLKVYQRTERDWMLLARGSAKLGHHEQTALAYQALLSLRPDYRKDPGLLADLRGAVDDPKAFRLVLNLAESLLGRHGVDLIWLLWEDERLDPNRKEQADKLAKKLVILTHSASPALRVAIELTFTTSCEKLHGILGRAASVADSRSLERLTILSNRSGCGASKSDDCFPCLRVDDLVERARDRAKTIAAPALGRTPED